MNQTLEQQLIMKECRKRFLETGEVDARVRPFVAESWARCRQYEESNILHPDVLSHLEVLPEKDMKQKLEENKMLLRVARPVLMKLMNMMAGTPCAITLHDKEGWIIDHLFSGDDRLFSVSGYKPGIHWAEDVLGTCSSHTALALDREIQLVGYEHYLEPLCGLVGTAAPLHDNGGELIGCLNMCWHYSGEPIYAYSLGLIKAMALLIERDMESAYTAQILGDTFDVLSDGIILLDTRYHVLEASAQAASVLKMPRTALYSLDVRDMFRYEDFGSRLQNSDAPFSYAEYDLDTGSGTVTCNVQVIPLVSENRRNGAIVILRGSRDVRRQADEAANSQARYCFADIITQDPDMRRKIDTMRDIAATDCCVLIEGESGTGKELFAHSLHNASNRREGPFIAVNCAALPHGLVESELFGYEKGAFTGARSGGNPGKFELAQGGTIFLDEIGELPMEVQATLLRVLDNHRIVRIGGNREKNLDVRVIAATNRNLYQEVQRGNFRGDLYFRINVLKFDIPPLRKRDGDAVLLAQTFLKRMNDPAIGQKKTFSAGALRAIDGYLWPGNVRELQNVVTRAYYASRGTLITEGALQEALLEYERADEGAVPIGDEQKDPSPQQGPAWGPVAEAERQMLIQVLVQTGGNVEQAAQRVGMSRATLYRRIKKYQISLK